MNAGMNWHGDEATKQLWQASWDSLRRAVVYYWNRLQDALNKSAKVGKGTKHRDYEPSRPGEPPRKRTGWLQRHVLYEFDQQTLTARVGVAKNALYGLFLELGTRKMAARPWLLATLRRFLPQIKAIAESGKEQAA